MVAVRAKVLHGKTPDTTTRAMGMALDDIAVPRPQIDLALARQAS